MRCLAVVLLVVPATSLAQVADLSEVEAGQYDNGKMWTFDYPPIEHLQETYDFTPDEAWFEKARLGALRLPNCTASFVSPHGLVMTNHHCGRGQVAQVSQEGENLLDDGFMAKSLEAERAVEGLYVDQLIAIEDVTDEIFAALDGQETDAEKASARQEAIAAATERITQAAGGEDAGVVVQVVNLYNGGRYSAYTFRRYTDVRLVMAPELQLGYFGGDTDNFTFPRYALDMTFFRVYEDGEPYEPQHYFKWSTEGSEEGDVVFVIGNPGSTLRLETVAQLEWRRDVQEKAILDLLNSRIKELMAYYDENPSPALLNQVFGLRNTQKLYGGRVKGLNDPVIMAKRADTERQFLEDLREKYGETVTEDIAVPFFTLIDDLAGIQAQKREYAADFAAFLAFQPGGGLTSGTLGRAILAHTYLQQQQASAGPDALAPMREQLTSISQDAGLDRRYMIARLNDFVTYFGADDPGVQAVMKGRTAEAVADAVLAASALTSPEKTTAALDEGTLTMDDPAIQLVVPFIERRQNFQSAFAGLGRREQELNAQHGRARFEVYGTAIPPDATFSLRIADGVVKSYEYNGSHAPAFTTYHGLYNRHYSHAADANNTGEWDLPETVAQPTGDVRPVDPAQSGDDQRYHWWQLRLADAQQRPGGHWAHLRR